MVDAAAVVPGGLLHETTTTNLNPIVVKGNMLFDGVSKARFFAKGVDYNPNPVSYDPAWGGVSTSECTGGDLPLGPFDRGTDLIADEMVELWTPDLAVLADMGVNTVRVYEVDPTRSHDLFMNAAAEHGIYVVVSLTRALWGFLPGGFPSPGCYNDTIDGYGNVGTNLLNSAKSIVAQFSQFDNTLFFTVANEVSTSDEKGYAAMPCVKALVRDIHSYQDECVSGMRRVPLVYAATDVGAPNRRVISDFLTCNQQGDNEIVDIYGINVYSWCDEYGGGEVSPAYLSLADDFATYETPLVLTEFGCNQGDFGWECPYEAPDNTGRTWPQIPALIGDADLQQVFSGSMAYEYSMEENQFGLVLKPGFFDGQEDSVRRLNSSYQLGARYNDNDLPSSFDGDWDDDDLCTWTPTTTSTHRRSTCPSAATVQAMFDALSGLSGMTQNWDDLPPTPPNTDYACPSYTLTSRALKENCCHTDCSFFTPAPTPKGGTPSPGPTPTPHFSAPPHPEDGGDKPASFMSDGDIIVVCSVSALGMAFVFLNRHKHKRRRMRAKRREFERCRQLSDVMEGNEGEEEEEEEQEQEEDGDGDAEAPGGVSAGEFAYHEIR